MIRPGEYNSNKIIVLGCSGSGKSTFAIKLSEITQIPLFHLDNIYWNADRSHLTNEEFDHEVERILQGKMWIVDGNYPRTYETRIQACDTIIFLDYTRLPMAECMNQRLNCRREEECWNAIGFIRKEKHDRTLQENANGAIKSMYPKKLPAGIDIVKI